MSAVSNYLENALINSIFRGIQLASPTQVFLALYTTDPTDADVGVEVSGGSYARQAITFGAPSNGQSSNSVSVTFPLATATWGAITHCGIRDALTGGNLLWHGAITFPLNVVIDDQVVFSSNSITVSIA